MEKWIKLGLGISMSFGFVLIGLTFFALSKLPEGFKGL